MKECINVREYVDNWAAKVAQQAHVGYMHNMCTQRQYLYYRPGELRVAIPGYADLDGWTIAISEALPMNLTEQQLCNWIRERLGAVPFLPTN